MLLTVKVLITSGTGISDIYGCSPNENVSIVLVGNKTDSSYRTVDVEEAVELAKRSGIRYIETSASANTNISNAMHDLCTEIYEKSCKNNQHRFFGSGIQRLNDVGKPEPHRPDSIDLSFMAKLCDNCSI